MSTALKLSACWEYNFTIFIPTVHVWCHKISYNNQTTILEMHNVTCAIVSPHLKAISLGWDKYRHLLNNKMHIHLKNCMKNGISSSRFHHKTQKRHKFSQEKDRWINIVEFSHCLILFFLHIYMKCPSANFDSSWNQDIIFCTETYLAQCYVGPDWTEFVEL